MTIFRKDEFELCEVPVPEGYPQSQTHCGVICVMVVIYCQLRHIQSPKGPNGWYISWLF